MIHMALMLGKNLILEGDVNFLVKSAVEQVSTKTEDFLEKREGYWQAQLWTYDPYSFKEFNSGRRHEFLG